MDHREQKDLGQIFSSFLKLYSTHKSLKFRESRLRLSRGQFRQDNIVQHYSDWVCTAVMSNDVMNDLRG